MTTRIDKASGLAGDSVTALLTGPAGEMTQALDEIVWAVNPTNDSLDKLVSFTCEFARAILEPAGIRCRLDLPDQVPELDLSSQIRHQLCMALKECLNNVLKHARAHSRQLMEGGRLVLHWIRDETSLLLMASAEPLRTLVKIPFSP